MDRDFIYRVFRWNMERDNLEFNPRNEYLMLKEELDEFLEAVIEGDIVKMVDAAADLSFVAHGTIAKATGGDLNKVYDILKVVADANDAKGTAKDENGKIIKHKEFVNPEKRIEEILGV